MLHYKLRSVFYSKNIHVRPSKNKKLRRVQSFENIVKKYFNYETFSMLLVTSLHFKEKRCGKKGKHSAFLIYDKNLLLFFVRQNNQCHKSCQKWQIHIHLQSDSFLYWENLTHKYKSNVKLTHLSVRNFRNV